MHTIRTKHTHKFIDIGALVVIVALLVMWQLSVDFRLIPRFLLPSPTDVCSSLIQDAPLLFQHSLVTLYEAGIGLAIGVIFAFILAIAIDCFAFLKHAIEPLLTISQTIPTIAIAPLLVLWFGTGTLPKIILVVLTTFFPITISLVQGFASVSSESLDLMKTLRAKPWQVFIYLKLPAVLEYFISGLTVAATYAIVAAVIAEWLGGASGLGVYMTRVRKGFAYDRMFASIFVISALSLVVMQVIHIVKVVLLPWKNQ